MYLVQLSKIGKLIIEDDGIYAIPEFRELLETKGFGEPAMRAIALIQDYESPYRHRPEDDRPTFVLRDVYGRDAKKTLSLKNPKCKAAIEKYNLLQYDPYREELKATDKIIQVSTKLKNNLDVTDETKIQTVLTYVKRIEALEKRRESLMDKITEHSSEGPVKEGIPLYRLEKKLHEENQNKNNYQIGRKTKSQSS